MPALRKPVELSRVELNRLSELFDDVYYRKLGALIHNTAITDVDVSGMAGDALTIGNKVNEILAMLRSAKMIKEA